MSAISKISKILPRYECLAFPMSLSRAKRTIRTLTLCDPAILQAFQMEGTDHVRRVLRVWITAVLPDGTLVSNMMRCSAAGVNRLYPAGTIFRLRTTYRRALKRKRLQPPCMLRMVVLGVA